MREFICGQATLVHCGGELLGLAALIVFVLVVIYAVVSYR